jgi:ketosteroid isomerase-like protein
MTEAVVFDGGTDAERTRLLDLHRAYLEANATFDVPALRRLWSTDPRAVFFNLNGHTYVGVEHWARLWEYYRTRLHTGLWTATDVKLMVRGDMAVITCHRLSPVQWVGAESEPAAYRDQPRRRSRSTMVFAREGGDWRVVHTHFSEASSDARPGNI